MERTDERCSIRFTLRSDGKVSVHGQEVRESGYQPYLGGLRDKDGFVLIGTVLRSTLRVCRERTMLSFEPSSFFLAVLTTFSGYVGRHADPDVSKERQSCGVQELL